MTADELKKEAWDYMVDHAILNETNKDVEQAYFDAAKPREKRIEELEKENAELKESIKYVNTICERKSVTNSQLTELAADSSAKLCKAKGILKRLLEEEKNNMYWEMDGSDKSSYYKVRKEAEQFLKEVEE